jgi:uncharacterized repeat protein (TIGR01451 family)
MRRKRQTALLLAIFSSGVLLVAAPAQAGIPHPTISGFSPTQGPIGTGVRIFGTDFQGASTVDFNGTPATPVDLVSHTEIDVGVPQGATTGRIHVVHGQETATSPSSFTVTTGFAAADLSLSVTESADPVVADTPLTYTLSVQDADNNDASGAVLTDTLPAETRFSSASSSGSFDAGTRVVTWDLGTVPRLSRVTRTLTIEPIHPEAPMTNVAHVDSSSNDPSSGNNTASTTTTVNPEPGVHYFSVRDGGITPSFHDVALGETVQWDFFGPSAHRIIDSHGLGYLDTGLHAPIDTWRFTFNQSAEFRTKDLDTFPLNTNKIVVPVQTSPSVGTPSTTFLVTWALAAPPTGLGVDVQIKRPGGVWQHWRRFQTTRLSDSFVPDTGLGTYSFRTRMRNAANTSRSRFGPPVPITVTS